MTQTELDLYLTKLPAFKDHFLKNENSLLAKIFGVFTITTEHMKEVHVMLMENTVQLKNPKNLQYVFDLKGSTVDRKEKGATKPSSTLKDQNFLLVSDAKQAQGKQFVHLTPHDRRKLIAATRKDVAFLRE